MPNKSTNKQSPAPRAYPKKEKSAAKKVENPRDAVIHDTNGVYVRTYSLAEHGEDYLILAEQFSNKTGYSVTYK